MYNGIATMSEAKEISSFMDRFISGTLTEEELEKLGEAEDSDEFHRAVYLNDRLGGQKKHSIIKE